MWPNRVRKRAIESAIRFNHAVRLSPRPYVKLTNSELIVQKKRLAPRGTGYREADAAFQRAADREHRDAEQFEPVEKHDGVKNDRSCENQARARAMARKRIVTY